MNNNQTKRLFKMKLEPLQEELLFIMKLKVEDNSKITMMMEEILLIGKANNMKTNLSHNPNLEIPKPKRNKIK